MGHLLSNRKRYPGSRHARWIQVAVAGWLALCGALAQADVISVVPIQAGGVLTLTVSDNDAADMCSGGACAVDFTIDYDPAALEFVDAASVFDFFPAATSVIGGPQGGQVWVSLFADPDNFPASDVLFSVGFRVLMTQQVALTIGPRDFGAPVDGAYLPLAVDVTFNAASAVPEPNTALLAALALACLAWRRRLCVAHDRHPVRSA